MHGGVKEATSYSRNGDRVAVAAAVDIDAGFIRICFTPMQWLLTDARMSAIHVVRILSVYDDWRESYPNETGVDTCIWDSGASSSKIMGVKWYIWSAWTGFLSSERWHGALIASFGRRYMREPLPS